MKGAHKYYGPNSAFHFTMESHLPTSKQMTMTVEVEVSGKRSHVHRPGLVKRFRAFRLYGYMQENGVMGIRREAIDRIKERMAELASCKSCAIRNESNPRYNTKVEEIRRLKFLVCNECDQVIDAVTN